MSKKFDLVDFLKNFPKGTSLWSNKFGRVYLSKVKNIICKYPIVVYRKDGELLLYDRKGGIAGLKSLEPDLYPSPDYHDWNKLKEFVPTFKPYDLKPGDKVLVRNPTGTRTLWRIATFSFYGGYDTVTCELDWKQAVPYNDETRHLIGTSCCAPAEYKWWEE